VLTAGETICALTSGKYENQFWLVVLTDKRLLFLDKGVFGLKQVELPLKQISAITHKTGVLFGELWVYSSAGMNAVRNIPKAQVPKIAMLISNLVQQAEAPVAAAPATDVASQLERLAALVEKGLLTREEFAAQKAKLLS
jgi:hypothetical protein